MSNDKGDPPDQPHDDRSKLPTEIGEALSAGGLDIKDPQLAGILISLMRFQGSLQYPPAEILEGWERVYPGITRELVEQTQKQTSHRHVLESTRASRSEDRADRGQYIMAFLSALGLISSAVVGIFGSWIVGSILAVVSVGGPAAAAILAHRMGWSRNQSQK